MRLALVAVVTVFVGALAPPAWSAPTAGKPNFAVKPVTYDPKVPATKSYFVLGAQPGAVIHDRFEVVNKGDAVGTAFLYPVDATTGQTSGAVYLSRQAPRRDVGSWVRLGVQSVRLAPGESRVISFDVRVPPTLRPGDHLGGIVAENAQLTQPKGRGPLQIKIRHLTIVAVQMLVPGKRIRRFEIVRVRAGGEHGYQFLYLSLRNRGTVMVKPGGSVVVNDAHGREVAKRSFRLDTFLPQTHIEYPLLLPGQALSPGRYSATVDVGYGNGARTFPFTVSSAQATKVYSGAPALKAPHSARSHRSPLGMLPWLVALLATLAAVVALVSRRWALRQE